VRGRWIEVEFNGLRLFVEENVLRGEGDGPLAPPEHIEDGELNPFACFRSDSYAHVRSDGVIKRFRAVIGTVADLKPVTPTEVPR
jgi:hypothetical protein